MGAKQESSEAARVQRDRTSEAHDAEHIASGIVDSAVKIHSALGPGLLESAYQACLTHELRRRGHKVVSEVLLPLEYEGLTVEKAYRIDMLVDDLVVIENKVAQNLQPIHQAQVFT